MDNFTIKSSDSSKIRQLSSILRAISPLKHLIFCFDGNEACDVRIGGKKIKNEKILPFPYKESDITSLFKESKLIGVSKHIQEIRILVEKYAECDKTVLITGETGVGKEIVAQDIHSFSRAKYEFVAINCSAMPELLLESELFGHSRGAFTGAISDKKGLFEIAENGTVFLDEVNSMPGQMQAKLLRFLQNKKFRKVGGDKEISVNVRIIAASNAPLKPLIERGLFRDDLYYRLAVLPIEIKPLRERKEDIPCLIKHFCTKKISEVALKKLGEHDWHGNVRELLNVLERAEVLSEGIEIEDIKID